MSDLTASSGASAPAPGGVVRCPGIAQLVLSIIAWFDVIALPSPASYSSGALLLVAGVFQIIHAFMDREWGAFILHLLVGLLWRVIGGFLLMDEPPEGSLVITILIGVRLGHWRHSAHHRHSTVICQVGGCCWPAV